MSRRALPLRESCVGLRACGSNKVLRGSPAEHAGVRAGDVVSLIDGAAPGRLDSAEDRLSRAGAVAMRVVRGGAPIDVILDLSPSPEPRR
jgi:S1-C subfamily serine protease